MARAVDVHAALNEGCRTTNEFLSCTWMHLFIDYANKARGLCLDGDLPLQKIKIKIKKIRICSEEIFAAKLRALLAAQNCPFALKLRHQSPGTRSEACGHRQPFPLLI